MTETRAANPDENEAAHAIGEPIVEHLMGLPPQIALTVLVYVLTMIVLNLTPRPGRSRVEAFNSWADCVRMSIAENEAKLDEVSSS